MNTENEKSQNIHLFTDAVTPDQENSENQNQSNTPTGESSKRQSQALTKAGQEIINGNFDPECWALALQQSDGSKLKAKMIYINIRSTKLIDENRKLKSIEETRDQRLFNCFRPATVKARPYSHF